MAPPKSTLDDLRIERSAKPGSKTWPIVLAVVALIFATGAVWWANRTKPVQVHTVLARETSGGSADRTILNASGYVTARREATVSSKVTGKVIEVMIEEGLKVKAGQVLARLDDTNVRASLRLAEAQLDSAKKALEETRVRIKEADLNFHRIT